MPSLHAVTFSHHDPHHPTHGVARKGMFGIGWKGFRAASKSLTAPGSWAGPANFPPSRLAFLWLGKQVKLCLFHSIN